MTKLFFLSFLSLLCFCHLSAQTDSTRQSTNPSAAERNQDTTTPRPHLAPRRDSASRRDSVVRHTVRHDSAYRRRDSMRRDSISRGLMRSDSVRREGIRRDSVLRDSMRRDSAIRAGIMKDSASRRDSLAAVAAANLKKGPPMLSFWKAVLSANPSFNFLGKPVLPSFEIHRPNSKDSLFYLLLGILFYFALVRIFFEKYFGNLITLFFRVSLRQQQIREQVLQTPLPSLLLNLLFLITGGLYACFLLHYSRFGPSINFWLLYVDCMVGLGGIYLVKFLVLKFCGWVFNISRGTDTYIFVVFLVNKMLGIFLLPFLILITFSGPEAREIFITISLVMILLLLAYRVLAAYRPVRNEIKLTPFHFFLYLCAFEIAPLLLIYKVLLTYLEKVY